MNSGEVFKGINYKIIGAMPENISGVEDNPDNVRDGYCFFAVNGEKYNGEDFVAAAAENGADVVVSEKPLNLTCCNVIVGNIRECMGAVCKNFYLGENPKIKITGVVGTNGKTSVCHVLYNIFSYAGKQSAYLGTLGGKIGEEETESELTTPGTVELYKFIGKAEKAGTEYLFMELSAHAICQKRDYGLFYESLIFTNCTEDHLDYFKTMEEYAAVKKSAFDRRKCKYMIINSDDATGREILNDNEGANVLTYGIYNPADVFAIDITERTDGLGFIVNLFDIIYEMSSPLIGLCNVYNLLASLCFGALAGLKIHTLSGAVRKIGAISGRAERIAELNNADIFLDYAHTPDGLKTTLRSMRKICRGKLYCLFGCGGNREREKRSIMGEISGAISDFTVITSDNPRFEEPIEIISEIERGIKRITGNYITIDDRKEAIAYALSMLKSGDLLVIAGKGAENYQDILGVKHPFSDKEEVAAQIRGMKEGDKS